MENNEKCHDGMSDEVILRKFSLSIFQTNPASFSIGSGLFVSPW